jgi:hypothetical protein
VVRSCVVGILLLARLPRVHLLRGSVNREGCPTIRHHIRLDDWEEKTVNVEGITWHTIVLDPFAATKALLTETFGLAPAMDTEGSAGG